MTEVAGSCQPLALRLEKKAARKFNLTQDFDYLHFPMLTATFVGWKDEL